MNHARRTHFQLVCIAAMSLFLVRASHSQTSYEYIGPVETLDNGVVTLEVSLKTGRIVSFRKNGQPDWIAVWDEPPIPNWNWNPWGGDRIWPTAQHLFSRIYKNDGADPVIDGEPWTLVNKTSSSIEYVSGTSVQLGIQIIRSIELPPGVAEAINTFTFKYVSESNYPVHAWAITGVHYGESILMESDPANRYPDHAPFKWWPKVNSERPSAELLDSVNTLSVSSPSTPLKLGTYGRWIAQIKGPRAFLQSIPYDPSQLYLEESSLQTYLNPVTHTYEIETVSPAWHLKKGEVKKWSVHWKLLDLPKDANTAVQKASFLKQSL